MQSQRDIEVATRLVELCERHHLNFCSTYEDWTNAALAMATLGEAGRYLFHRLACLDRAYKPSENNRKFTSALRTTSRRLGSGRCITLGTLIERVRRNGYEFNGKGGVEGCGCSSSANFPVVRPVKSYQPTDYIPHELFDPSIGRECNLFRFLAREFGEKAVRMVFNIYHMASVDGISTIYPQIDQFDRIRTAKIITYNESTGHRDRSKGANWYHSLYRSKIPVNGDEYNLSQCLFGAHLLGRLPSDTAVGLVEAEKTALIMSMVIPQKIWIATGGLQLFSASRLEALRPFRNVTVYADADGATLWKERFYSIPYSRSWTFSDWHESLPEGSHDDIADAILRTLHPAQA